MRPQPQPSRTRPVLTLVGVGDKVVREEGPRTPFLEFLHRLPEYAGRFIVSMGGSFAFVLAVAVILGFRL